VIRHRDPKAPVVISGWLFKQGSDGLMLWKKRWFALSQYCLFYYDGKPNNNNNNNSFCGNYAEKRLVFFYSSRRYFFFFFFFLNENALLKMRQTEVAQRTEMSREGLCSTCREISLIIRDDTHTHSKGKERIKKKERAKEKG
jgi:hypothetical protein